MTTLRLVLLLLLVLLLSGRTHMRPQETGFDPAVARKMMEFKTEMIKSRILQEVNLLEPPLVTEPVTVSEDMLRLLESKDLEESILGEGDNLIAYPVNDDTSCENVTSCSRYEYELPADNKLSFVHIWIRNTDPDQPMDLSVCVAYSADIDDRPCELLKNATEVKREKGWGIYELPRRLVSESYGDQLLCTVDVIGPPVNDMKDDQKPFIVASRNNEATMRRRRSTGSGGTGGTGSGSTAPGSKNCTCCLVDFHVSFEDINWHWVVAPKKFNAYMCYGKCSSQINSYRSNYHQMVHTVTNINKTTSSVVEKKAKTAEEASWTPCCSPTKLSPLSMIYVEGNTTAIANSTKAPTYIYHKIPNMITESCGCW